MFDIQETTNNGDCSFTTKLEDQNVIEIGSDVTLSCCLDREYPVQWYKDQCEISMNDKFEFKDELGEHKLIIADIQEDDSGVYSCKCGTTKTSCKLNVAECSFTTKLEDRNVIGIGSDVMISCCLNKEFDVQWYKDQEEITLNYKFKIEDGPLEHKLIIVDIQENDSGVYSCHCGTTKTRCELKVEDCSCSFTTNLVDRNVIGIGSDVTLSCCLDKEYGVRWCKDGCEIFLNDRFKFKDERFKHQLIIADIQEADSGVYSCQCGRTKTSCKLKVKVNLLIKQLEDVTIDTDQKLILTCKLNAKCTNVKWFKTNGAISCRATTNYIRIGGSNAHMYKLELNPVKMEDTGEYSCHMDNIITTCNVTVKKAKEIQIDDSVPKTTLLYELKNTKDLLKVTKDELSNTRKELNRAATDVDQKEIIIKERETEITKLRARIQEQEIMLKCRDSELENKDNYIKELEDKSQQLAECVKKLELTYKELESTKELLAQMQEKIEKLEAEKQDLEVRISIFEAYINDGKINEQQQKVNEQQQKANEQQQKANEQQLKANEQQQKVSEKMMEANRFIKQLEDVTINAGEKLILACELDAECTNVKWCKTNGVISHRATTTDVKIAGSNAHRYKLELILVRMEDDGEYSCQIKNAITTCNVLVNKAKEIQIDGSVPKTTLLYELKNTKDLLKVTKDELSNTRKELNRTETDVDQKEIIIKERETEITELKARLQEQEIMLKCRDSELENKDNYIKELKDKNQQLAECVKKLELAYTELESTKKLLAQMQEQIEKLETEKQDLEVRISVCESYINDGKISKQLQQIYEQQQTIHVQLLKSNEKQQKVLEKIMEEKNSKTCSVS